MVKPKRRLSRLHAKFRRAVLRVRETKETGNVLDSFLDPKVWTIELKVFKWLRNSAPGRTSQ